jgi:hypothetical protein
MAVFVVSYRPKKKDCWFPLTAGSVLSCLINQLILLAFLVEIFFFEASHITFQHELEFFSRSFHGYKNKTFYPPKGNNRTSMIIGS